MLQKYQLWKKYQEGAQQSSRVEFFWCVVAVPSTQLTRHTRWPGLRHTDHANVVAEEMIKMPPLKWRRSLEHKEEGCR